MSYLLDTNVISEPTRLKPNEKVMSWLQDVENESLYISVITLGEIRKGIEKLPRKDIKKKQKLKIWLEKDIREWFGERVLDINFEVADRWGRLISAQNNLPAIDSLIAATALHHDLVLITRNIKDFDVSGLELFNPWQYE